MTATLTSEPVETLAPAVLDADERRDETSRTSLFLLLAYVVCLLGIPSVLIFRPLGAAGTPAGVMGDALLIAVALTSFATRGRYRVTTPIMWLLFVMVFAWFVSYAVGGLRPIVSLETNSMDRGLISIGSWCGVALAISGGINSRQRLDAFLRVVVYMGTFVAVVGLMQFFFGFDVARWIRIPGLTANHDFGGLTVRDGFRRISGTAMHAIEFGAVLSMILPIAFHYSFTEPEGRRRRLLQICTAVICFSIPLTVARSAIMGLVVGLTLLFFTWTPAQKWRALVILPLALLPLKVAVPHLLGVLSHLFTQAANDPSVQNRLSDWTAAGYLISHSPIFGNGLSTAIPVMWRTYDDAYIGVLIESGFLGFIALIALFVGAVLTALYIRSSTSDPATRSLAYSLMTALVAAAFIFYSFDAFSYPMCTGVFFIVLGAISCLWRQQFPVQFWAFRARGTERRRRFVAKTSIALVAVLGVLGGLHLARGVPPTYEALGTVELSNKPVPDKNIFYTPLYLGDVAALVSDTVKSTATRERFAAEGFSARYEIARGDGSLMPVTDVMGTGDVLRIASRSQDPELATRTTQHAMDEIEILLTQWQTAANANPNLYVHAQVSIGPDTYPLSLSKRRSEVMIVLLGILFCVASWRVVDLRARRSRLASASTIQSSL